MTVSDFQAALALHLSGAPGLEESLSALSYLHPPLRKIALSSGTDGSLVVLLGFDDTKSVGAHAQRLTALAKACGGELQLVHDLAADPMAVLEMRPWLPTHADVTEAFIELRREARPALRVSFDSTDALLAAWARQVAEGGLWVPMTRVPAGDRYTIALVTPDATYAGNPAKRIPRDPLPGRLGLWLEVEPGDELKALFARIKNERTATRLQAQPIQRFESDLDLPIATVAELSTQWQSTLSRGGAFVLTPKPPALRARLRVHLSLPNGETLTLAAEVVHRVLTGPQVGVGVQFVDLTPTSWAPVEALLSGHRARPRVLVCDDEAIWRSTLVRVLKDLDVDVILAKDGREGMLRLIESYFELDLVVLDLHMPNIDGRGLLERVRRLGGDQQMRVFLFSAAAPDELAALKEPGWATAVFSKIEPVDLLAAQLARELGRPWPPPQSGSALRAA